MRGLNAKKTIINVFHLKKSKKSKKDKKDKKAHKEIKVSCHDDAFKGVPNDIIMKIFSHLIEYTDANEQSFKNLRPVSQVNKRFKAIASDPILDANYDVKKANKEPEKISGSPFGLMKHISGEKSARFIEFVDELYSIKANPENIKNYLSKFRFDLNTAPFLHEMIYISYYLTATNPSLNNRLVNFILKSNAPQLFKNRLEIIELLLEYGADSQLLYPEESKDKHLELRRAKWEKNPHLAEFNQSINDPIRFLRGKPPIDFLLGWDIPEIKKLIGKYQRPKP